LSKESSESLESLVLFESFELELFELELLELELFELEFFELELFELELDFDTSASATSSTFSCS